MPDSYTFFDCQGFAGGFACGATQAGFKLVGKAENKKGFGAALMEANRAFLGDGWESQLTDPADWVPIPADVVLGNPPCSAFSSMTAGYDKHGSASPINDCMWDLTRFAAKVKPKFMLMESVGQAYTRGQALMRALTDEMNTLSGGNYQAYHILQNNYSMGGVTMRRRYFLVLTEMPFGVEPAELKWLPTIYDALSDLRNLELTWDEQPIHDNPTWWSYPLRSVSGTVDGHKNPSTGRYATKLLDLIGPDGVEWNEGDAESDVLRRYYQKFNRLPESWCYESHNGSGLTRDKELIDRDFNAGGFAKARCWPWNKPGRVITGSGPYQLWHPDGRFATHREIARVMGFPDDWVVGTAANHPHLFMHWGKGTSVHPAKWVMDWVMRSLNGEPGKITGDLLSDGTRLIDLSKEWMRAARRYELDEVA